MRGAVARLARGFTTREALFLGFCATFVVLTRVALRWHLNLPGHSALFLAFFLLLGRACVPRTGAATFVGGVAGVVVALLGMGRGGPLLLLKLLLPGLVVDAGAAFAPRFAGRVAICALLGALSTLPRGLVLAPLEWLLGMDAELLILKTVLASAAAMVFGAVGGALVPPIYRRLAANGLLPARMGTA
jgi:hypothetical protein